MRYYNESEQRRQDELLKALFTSVASGNLGSAQSDLRMIAAALSGPIGEMAAQAGFDRNRPYSAPDLAVPFVLPIPGHEPGMTLSGHAFVSGRK